MAWIESHQELARHPKTRRLSRELGVSLPGAIGQLHLFWYWAIDHAPDGDLTGVNIDDLANGVMWEGDPVVLVQALQSSEFVDADLQIHDWKQYSGRRRFRRRRLLGRPRPSVRRHWESIARTIRPLVFSRDGHACVYCGRTQELEVDHRLALARGGSNDLENLQTLCRPCNRSKGAG